jgi:ferredoxin
MSLVRGSIKRRSSLNVEKLKEAVREVLPSVDAVIAYRAGGDPLHAEPCFIKDAGRIEELILNPLCEHNLASYLAAEKRRVAVVVKGCDSRSVIQLLQEGLVKRENIVIIGVPCRGVVSVKKVAAAVGHEKVLSVAFEGDAVIVKTASGEKRLALIDVSPAKCATCRYPTPLLYDVLVGEPIEPAKPADAVYDDVRKIEAMPLPERWAYWEKELGRCVRCYACRNACPMCVCTDSCIAESREPHWMSQKTTAPEKMMFHLIHALHLAGRCTECGECERACPMNIPLGMLKKKINLEMLELFGYTAGTDPTDKPPLFTFRPDEERIEEHKLS